MFVLQLLPDLASLAVDVAFRIAFFVIGFTLVYVAGRLLIEPVLNRVLRARDIELTIQRPIQRLAHVAVLFVALTVAFSAAGLGNLLSASATIAAAFTLAVGLASQDLMSNVVSGAFIIANDKFEIGDWIQWGDTEGVVEDIGFRVTRVRTFDGELVTVPNSALTDNEVTNPVATGQLRTTLTLTVSREHDVETVTELLLDEATAHPAVLSDPEPSVRATELGAASVTLQVRFWIVDPDRTDFVTVRSEYIRAVNRRLAREGVTLAS